METITTIEELRRQVNQFKRDGKSIGFVPTMGALHKGHLSLMREAKRENNILIISIFVNPTQFGPNEDFNSYPRQLEQDQKAAESVGVDIIFAPTNDVIYPEGYATYVVQERLTEKLCGAFRPGHFQGVLTVVAKLFNIVHPDRAYFGQKDYQQSVVIKKMVEDLNIPTEIIVLPIVREQDGLAISSRNKYLSGKERSDALCLYNALERAQSLYKEGERNSAKIIKEMESIIKQVESAQIDYISIVHPETLEDVANIGILEPHGKNAVVALAVRIGGTRLIDNAILCGGSNTS